MSITPPEIPVTIRVSVSVDGQDQHAGCREVEHWLRARKAALELDLDAAESALDYDRRTIALFEQEPYEECARPMPPSFAEHRYPFEWRVYELEQRVATLEAQAAELVEWARLGTAWSILEADRAGGLDQERIVPPATRFQDRIDAGEFGALPILNLTQLEDRLGITHEEVLEEMRTMGLDPRNGARP